VTNRERQASDKAARTESAPENNPSDVTGAVASATAAKFERVAPGLRRAIASPDLAP
jgi:hypothetical protein